MTKIEILLQSPLNVFTVQDLATLWGMSEKERLWSTIRYYLRIKKLKRLHKGIYSIATKPYTSYQIAQKLITPSYISFYTALAVHGVIFQFYETIYSMALVSKKLKAATHTFSYHKIKERLFFDPLGIEEKETYKIAGPERAICDSLYLVPRLSFDSLGSVDLGKLHEVARIYHNKRLVLEVEQIIKSES